MAPADTYNKLVLGETWSGKSALINYMRKYAGQEFTLNTNAIEPSTLSHATEVTTTTNLPEYHGPEKGVGKINYEEYLKIPVEYNYEDALSMRKCVETKRGDPRLPKTAKFNSINTFGLNATQGYCKHVQKILDGFNKPKTVHLRLTTISSVPLAQGPQGAIEFYRNKFPAVNGAIPVQTHLDYKNLHQLISLPGAIGLTASLHTTAAMSLLSLKTDVYYKQPTDTQDTTQNVLELSTFDSAVDMPHRLMDMTQVLNGSTSRDKFETSTIDQTLPLWDLDEGELLTEILPRNALVFELEARIKVPDDYFLHDVLLVMPENRQNMNYEVNGRGKGISLMSPHFVLNDKNYTAKSNPHPEHKKLVQELQETIRHRNHLAPLIESRKQQIKETIHNHSNIIPIPGFVANKVPMPEGFHTSMETSPASASSESRETSSLTLPGAKKYLVLVLGKTQAGKTALVEHMMSYSTPTNTIDQSSLGDGTSSRTKRTRTVHARSNLPSYEVYDKSSGSAINFNPGEGDEEDIRDLLFSHEENMGLRPAPGTISDVVEFELLNIPGLCSQDKDTDQAVDTVDEIISTRSFNLILIIVNIHDPFTAEQLLILRTYSKILHGLHSNITFLYIHANYSHYLQPNENQQLALANRTRSLSHIFQGSVSGDLKPYPSFTIDLTEKRLPFFQCLMQNTLRDILQLAVSNPPVLMDTSSANLELINHIGHPSDFDNLQGEMLLARIYDEWCLQANLLGCPLSVLTSSCWQNTSMLLIGDTQSRETSPAGNLKLETELGLTTDEEPIVQGSTKTADETLMANTKPKLSVLILGRTQSGKSSLIQHFKQYADPTYTIDRSLLGNGNTSRTESTEHFFICSHLPAYEVVEIATEAILDLHNLSQNEFLDLLHGRDDQYSLREVLQDPNMSLDPVEFRFLDTPGLNDTGGRSISIAEDVLKEIIKTRSFNLILVTVSAQSPLTLEYRFELEYYAKVLQGLHSNVAFLYTHADYADYHHSNINHRSIISKRHSAFSEIFQGLAGGITTEDAELFKHFTIDLQLSKRPVVQCLIQNTLRDILQLAVSNSPAVLDAHRSNIERILAIAHPDKANRECKRFRAMQEARAAQSEGEERESSQHRTGAGGAGLASMAAVLSDSDSDIAGFTYDFGSVDGMRMMAWTYN